MPPAKNGHPKKTHAFCPGNFGPENFGTQFLAHSCGPKIVPSDIERVSVRYRGSAGDREEAERR